MIYLASQSPRRQELLRLWRVAFQLLLPSNLDVAESLESAFPHEHPVDYVERVTRLKWIHAAKRIEDESLENWPVLVADTTVALGSEMMGKPADAEEARHMLKKLSGNVHQVHTAVALGVGDRINCMVQTTSVSFCEISDSDIERYIQTQEPFGKAVAYGIQGLAGLWVKSIQGSYTGVMGLPAFETRQLLLQWGIDTPV